MKTKIIAISYICKSAINMITIKFARKVGDIDILTADVLTIRAAVIHARKNNYSKVTFDSDSLTTMQAINGNTTPS